MENGACDGVKKNEGAEKEVKEALTILQRDGSVYCLSCASESPVKRLIVVSSSYTAKGEEPQGGQDSADSFFGFVSLHLHPAGWNCAEAASEWSCSLSELQSQGQSLHPTAPQPPARTPTPPPPVPSQPWWMSPEFPWDVLKYIVLRLCNSTD